MSQRRYVILDRDGTIIKEHNHLTDKALVELIPGVASGLLQMRELGLGLVIVTNQSAIGRGILDYQRLDAIHARMKELLYQEGVTLDGIFFCPHTPEDNCTCRKPKVGLVELAFKELRFNTRECFIVGDKPCDIELGKRIGGITFLVRTGYGSQVEISQTIQADYVVDNLQAASNIMKQIIADRYKLLEKLEGAGSLLC
jgi:D-glycero-D-manno-heptose 1,7-bisphosphate phosphatase